MRRLGYALLCSLIILIFLGPLTALLLASLGVNPAEGHLIATTLSHFAEVTQSPLYLLTLLQSLKTAALATIAALLVALPIAYLSLVWSNGRWSILMLMLTVPFWSSDIVLAQAWHQTLVTGGWLYSKLVDLGLPQELVRGILYSQFAVWIVHLHSAIPMAVLIVYSGLRRSDWRQIEAAIDLGDTRVQAIIQVATPAIYHSILLAYFLIFVPLLGDFLASQMVGGSRGVQYSSLIEENFTEMHDFSTGAAASVLLIVVVTALGLLAAAPALFNMRNKYR